jgi:tetratricopeptide (TPR) repeat protein
VRSFFLFYILSSILRNPFLALLIVGAVVYFSEARYSGRYFNPSAFVHRRGAVQELRGTIANNEHDVSAHNDLGRLLADEGKFVQAAPHMERAIERMDELPETNFYHGLCLLETGREEDGVRFIERALEINDRYGYGKPALVLAQAAARRGDHEQASKWSRRAVSLNTSTVQGWLLYGRSQAALGAPDAAREAFVKAKQAYDGLPHYLKLGERQWLKEVKRELA